MKYGFNFVFFLAAIPALLNALQTLTWDNFETNLKKSFLKTSKRIFVKDAFVLIWKKRQLFRLLVNILIYSAVFVALGTFVQPYMLSAGLPLAYFGFVYSGFLLIVAFLTKYSSNLEERYGGRNVMNVLTLESVVPLLVLGFGYISFIGIGLFFFVLMVQNLRSPIANSLFHDEVDSNNRATMGSILSLFQNAGNLVLLPFIGVLADFSSISTAIMLLAVFVFFVGTMFWIKKAQF